MSSFSLCSALYLRIIYFLIISYSRLMVHHYFSRSMGTGIYAQLLIQFAQGSMCVCAHYCYWVSNFQLYILMLRILN